MRAVVLCAGHATRMRPLTSYVAKAMIPVAGRPLLEHILLGLRDRGFRDAIVALSQHADQVQHYFDDGSRMGLNLQYSVSDRPLGTAGEVDRLRGLLEAEEHFLVHYGDILTNLDARALAEEHLAHGPDVTLGLVTGVTIHTGLAKVDDRGRVNSFVEKPALATPTNAAVFALSRAALELCRPGADFSRDVFPELIAAGRPVRGFVDESAYWLDVGRLSDLDAANRLMGDEVK